MARFFISGSNLAGGTVFVTGEDAEHAKVLRLRVGDRLILCDGEGKDHHCRITRLSSGQLEEARRGVLEEGIRRGERKETGRAGTREGRRILFESGGQDT